MTIGAEEARATILIVDDEKDILVALEDLLGDDYNVLAATSPLAALDLVAAHRDIAVILSDQRMPEMPGHSFLARARQTSRAETLLLTGYADLSAVIAAVNEGGIAGYANKPWEPEALRAMVAAAAERYRLRQALAFEQAIFAGLADSSADAISVIDGEGRIVRLNARKAEALGGAASDWLGRREPAGPAAEDAAALSSGLYAETEARENEGGATRWTRTQRVPFDVAGAGRQLLKIERDETERRLIEGRLHQSEKLQALGTLAGGIAHDFNNLLAAVLGNLELAAGRVGDDAKLIRFVRNATEAAQRGTALTQRLLSFSRQRDLAAQTIAANDAVRGVEDLILRSMAGLHTLRYELGADVWPVRADRDQLELALLNLCINARDAMPGGGEIRVSTVNRPASDGCPSEDMRDHVGIAVTDTGTGIAPEVLARVYEPFFTTKAPGRGTGLGLSMVHSMAEASGGTTTIDSVPGAGTTVTIWLPRADDEPKPEIAARRPVGAGPSLRVLIVEDDREVRDMTAAHLDELGHEHVAVTNAREALTVLRDDARFDVLITDFVMPGGSGIELAETVAERWPWVPVVLVTGFAEIGENACEVRVLTKPFTRAGLHATLIAAVDAKRAAR